MSEILPTPKFGRRASNIKTRPAWPLLFSCIAHDSNAAEGLVAAAPASATEHGDPFSFLCGTSLFLHLRCKTDPFWATENMSLECALFLNFDSLGGITLRLSHTHFPYFAYPQFSLNIQYVHVVLS